MKRRLLALALVFTAPCLQAQTPAADIRAGRAALVASQPALARARFAATLAQPGLARDDRYAADMGLGQAALWLGDYRAADAAYREAMALAADEAARRAAATGLAQALNARDRPREAFALVSPFAAGDLRATVEVLRALQAIGWQERSTPYLEAAPVAPATGYLGTQYRLLHEDMDYALATKLDGGLDYSHDSEGLDTWHADAGFLTAPVARGGSVLAWGARADTTQVDRGARRVRVHAASALGQWRLGEVHRFDLALGTGRAGDWHFVEGAARWSVQPGDRFGLSATGERAPIPTATALAQRLIGNRYALDLSLRPASRWYLFPGVSRQLFSDGNHRDGGSLRLLLSPYDLPATRAALGAELSGRAFNDSRPSRGVYFNPAHYRAAQAGLVGVYGFNPGWKLRMHADAGRQWVNGTGAATYTLDLALEGRLPGNGRLTVHAGRSSAASASGGGAGYWNNVAAVSVSFPL